jgi:hypothetical protein
MTFTLLLGMALGAALLFLRDEIAGRAHRSVPKTWPLTVRPVVSGSEKRLWIWLTGAMYDHQILLKLPIARMTAPSSAAEAQHWYKKLNGIYCTFAICNQRGKIVGCVDVGGEGGQSIRNQAVKKALLSQCGIAYWVIDPDNRPSLAQFRTTMLGEQPIESTGFNETEQLFQVDTDRSSLGGVSPTVRQRESLVYSPS